MKQRKLFYALSGLDLVDLNHFKKYVHSPFFNVNETITKFFDLLEEKLRNEENIDEWSNEEIWPLVYGDEVYNNGKMLKLCSDLQYLLEDYYAQREYEENISAKANNKLAGARKRGQDKLYPKLIAELERLEKLDYNQSGEYFYKKYQIERSILDLINDNEKKNNKVEIETTINVSKISDNLDYFYIIEKLRLYCTVLSWKKMYKLNIDIDHIDTVEQIVSQEKYLEIPAISLYHSMKNTYIVNDDEYYYKLRDIMREHIHLFPQEEVSEIYSTAINYCISKVNKGLFENELFDLYKEGIDRNVFLTEGKMAPTMFRNIIFSALRIKKEAWAETFIEINQQNLEEKYRSNAVNFSKARVQFHKKEFGNTLVLLNEVTFEDIWYVLGTKTLQIACYYELNEYDALESLLGSFKILLKREKTLTQDRKDNYLSLVKSVGELIKFHDRKEVSKILKLREDIETNKNIVSKPWLLEKIDELLTSNKKGIR